MAGKIPRFEEIMQDQPRKFLIGGVAGFAITLLALFLVGIAVAYSGTYDVAATSGHSAFGRWVLSTTMHNSVDRRAAGIEVPQMSESMVAKGAGEYKAMCEHCHAGPGVSRAEWANGMVPKPPELAEAAAEWKHEEIFWIVKHGIRMSAMPAFGPTHDQQTLWSLTAFVSRLPGMTPATYRELAGSGSHAAEHSTHEPEYPAGHDSPHEREGH